MDAFEATIMERVGALKAPDEIAEQADRLVDIAEEQGDVLGELVAAARANNFAEARSLAERNDALNKVRADFEVNA